MGVFSGTQTKMFAKALAQALLLLPLISAQPPPPECCLEKEVGGILYQYVKTGAVASRCSNDCIYEKVDMPGKYFCFAPGDLHVECEDDEVTEAPGGELTLQFPSLNCRVTFTSLSSLSVSQSVIESVRYKLVNSSK